MRNYHKKIAKAKKHLSKKEKKMVHKANRRKCICDNN